MSDNKLFFKYTNEIGDDDVGVGEVVSYGAVDGVEDNIVLATIFYSFGGVWEFNSNFRFPIEILETLDEIKEDEFKDALTRFIGGINTGMDALSKR